MSAARPWPGSLVALRFDTAWRAADGGRTGRALGAHAYCVRACAGALPRGSFLYLRVVAPRTPDNHSSLVVASIVRLSLYSPHGYY